MSFIVNRPKVEHKLEMTRTDVRGRSQTYSWKAVRG
jgi:ribulose-bisphosphate carboxylase small chain